MQDFWGVYGRELGFLDSVNEGDIFVRTSVETRTMQVAGGFIAGMDPAFVSKAFPVTTQPSPVSMAYSSQPKFCCRVLAWRCVMCYRGHCLLTPMWLAEKAPSRPLPMHIRSRHRNRV